MLSLNRVKFYILSSTTKGNIIRNLPDPVHSALRLLAAQDGLSVEAEVHKILTAVCLNDRKPVSSLQQLVNPLYQGKKPANVVQQLIQER